MCNFVARTNRSNIESNYFVHTIIVFNLPYYTNVTITVTFVNQVTLYCAFVLFSPENYPHKSGAIFHINLYVFYIRMEIPNGTNKLNHVKWLAVFQNESFTIPYGRINHLRRHWNKCMLTIVQNTFYSQRTQWLPLVNEKFVIDNSVAVSIHFFWTWTIAQNTFYSRRARWLPLINERFVIDNSVAVFILFFGLGVTNDAAKPNCILPIGDNGSSYDDRSSGKLIVITINETQLSWKQQSCQ